MADRQCAELGVSLAVIRGYDRTPRAVAVRRAVARRLRSIGASYREIARVLSRDHRSVANLISPRAR